MQVRKWDGRPISREGWVSGIPIEKYHSAGMCIGKSVSSSDLRTCWSKSPAHMFAKWSENPQREERSMTDAMLLGACAHHLLLGEDNFRLKYVPYPLVYRDKVSAVEKPWHAGATYCKQWAATQLKTGRVPVKADMLQQIISMARSLKLEPLVDAGILRGHVECSGFVLDRETNLWVKVRPDVVPLGGEYVDLKTAAEVVAPAIQSAIRRFGYHQQGALIWEVCDQLQLPFLSFTLLFIETANPFCARTVPMEMRDLALGRQQNRAMLQTIAGCIETGHWPGPGEGDIRPLPLSSDEVERIEARLKFGG